MPLKSIFISVQIIFLLNSSHLMLNPHLLSLLLASLKLPVVFHYAFGISFITEKLPERRFDLPFLVSTLFRYRLTSSMPSSTLFSIFAITSLFFFILQTLKLFSFSNHT